MPVKKGFTLVELIVV
ncbi:MAG: prepilin-type N-terminal cleavage/methylation domain-containing protein, partial [Thermotogaceae bacterium]|nr:prepilin-type N-terminal cleavage/methylation domain-containing protein [Thermotogaceae bacterium]